MNYLISSSHNLILHSVSDLILRLFNITLYLWTRCLFNKFFIFIQL